MTWGSDLAVSLRGVVGEFLEGFGFCEEGRAGEESAEFVLEDLLELKRKRLIIGMEVYVQIPREALYQWVLLKKAWKRKPQGQTPIERTSFWRVN